MRVCRCDQLLYDVYLQPNNTPDQYMFDWEGLCWGTAWHHYEKHTQLI